MHPPRQVHDTIVVLFIASVVCATQSSRAIYLQQTAASAFRQPQPQPLVAAAAATAAANLNPLEPQAPVITPFSFDQNVQENQRSSVLCTISSGDLPVSISWLKDGQLITPTLAQTRKIIIKPDSDQSTLKFASVRLDHAGNYTCVAKNRAGVQTHWAQLVVHGEPRWVNEPQHEPIVATRGQTIVIDCQTTGWPKPQQSWQIKTHTQSEFEPLAATGRIWLASNGSLVIRNADKSDEANYRCKSYNGIGKGISWSTSLKVTVPAHFESSKQQTNVVRKQSQVQLRCDAYGDEPLTIEWYKNKQRLTSDADPRYTIHNKPLHSGLISLLLIKQAQRQDNALYECVTKNPVGRDRLPTELLVQEEPDNIQELQATQINSRSVTLMWKEPYDGRSSITNFMFQYKKIVQESSPSLVDFDFMDAPEMAAAAGVGSPSSGKQLSSVASSAGSNSLDDWQQASRLMVPAQTNGSLPLAATATIGKDNARSFTIDKLDPSSKYVLRALAINAIGQSKFSHPMEFTTEDEAPELGPTNIKAVANNSTSIHVSWEEIPKQFGRIHGYYIGYRAANSSAQNFVYKPYVINDLVLQQQQQSAASSPATGGQSFVMPAATDSRLETVIHDLRRNTTYEITVVAFNSRGSGPSTDFVLCKTIEMEAPKPVKLQIRRESNESIFIEWHRDPSDQNPVDDYVLYQEKNSASQEWLQVRLPGNQTQYKAPGLKCGTRYQFYIIAHNKVGKSMPSEVVSASTNGALPVIPSKTNLIKMVNSTCLMVNLNSFQDNGCRIKTFTVRYRVERPTAQMVLASSSGSLSTSSALTASTASASGSTGGSSVASSTVSSEWITIRPKSNIKHQRGNEEDRMEYLCDLNPEGEYTILVAASNDVGRSEIEYTVLMSSDELRYSAFREMLEVVYSLHNVFAYIPSMIVFLLAGLLLSIVSLVLYTTVIKYYQKFVIMQNQIRATRRAKQDEKRRRKLNSSRHSQKVDLWADEYEEEEEEGGDGDDEEDDEDESTATGSSGTNSGLSHQQHHHQRHQQQQLHCHQFANQNGHYMSNIANSAFDTSSIDSRACNNKFRSGGSCMSTASTDSIHGRFQCLNSKQYVKMNEYSMLPNISANLSPPSDIYGTTTGAAQHKATSNPSTANNSLYYSTLRRTNMQTYLPQQPQQRSPHLHQQQANHIAQQQQQQQQQHRHRNQNVNDIYGYYMGAGTATSSIVSTSQAQQQQAANEAANSIFVPPQQIIYSAPNIRRQPVFL